MVAKPVLKYLVASHNTRFSIPGFRQVAITITGKRLNDTYLSLGVKQS